MGDVDTKVHIYKHTALGIGRMANTTLSCLYPRGKHPLLIYIRLSGPQDQSGHKGVKKNLHLYDTWDPTQAVQPIAKRLAV